MLKRFARNTAGRDLIVGDIHGHFGKLQVHLDEIGFDPAAGDRLFSVGDLVDRGPDSDKALEWLAQPWFHAVAGNHEDFAIRWPNGHMDAGNYVANGGGWNVANPPEVQLEFKAAFEALPVAIELETEAGLLGIVHADCPYRSWDKFREVLAAGGREAEHAVMMAQWSRNRPEKLMDDEVSGVRAVIVGHTPMQRMASLGNVLFIDTGAWLGRHFTVIDAADLQPAGVKSLLDWAN